MVADQLRGRGIRDELVLAAMEKVCREAFVADRYRFMAYEDGPLPIGEGQTISQPYVVAFMIEALALKGGEKVLEIGAGSGYAAAVLSEIAGDVYAIERIGPLAEKAASHLDGQGYGNVHVRHADGTVVPSAGVISTHAFLARYPSTNTNVNRKRARFVFDYFLGIDIESLRQSDRIRESA